MIKDHTLDRAIIEALRFVKAARALRNERKAKRATPWRVGFVTSAAAKRASMDLTRALADLRQGR